MHPEQPAATAADISAAPISSRTLHKDLLLERQFRHCTDGELERLVAGLRGQGHVCFTLDAQCELKRRRAARN